MSNIGTLLETKRIYSVSDLVAALNALGVGGCSYIYDRTGEPINFVELREGKLTDGSKIVDVVLR